MRWTGNGVGDGYILAMSEEQSQITVAHHVDEDRLLLRMQLQGKEVRVWFTRRMTQNLFGIVEKLFDHMAGTAAQPPEQRETVSQFRQDQALTKANFSLPYEDKGLDLHFPDGPLLVTKADFKPRKDGKITIVLTDNSGDKTVAFTLGEGDLRAVLQLFIGTAKKAEWGLRSPPSMDADRKNQPVLH